MSTTTNSDVAAGGAVLEAPRGVTPHRRPGRQYTLSIDTGGTFTDGFVSDGERSAQVKVDTTPHDLTVGFQACVEAAADAVGEDLPSLLSSLSTFHFSSTIATNTIVERRGARVGLIVSAGATDDLYAPDGETKALLDFIDPELVRGVAEEVDADGRVVNEPDAGDIEAAVRELLERGVRLLVISFGNAHLNPANELRARAIIDRSYPRHYLGAVPLMISSRISLAPSNHGRTAVAVINAYLHPNLVRALYRAEDQTRERGMKRPLLIVNTDGSSSRVAKTRAIDTYNSGPSAGVLGSSYVARALGARHVCTFDVGGTTTDVAHLAGAEVPRDERTEVGAAAIPHPAVALWSFGLGGGSIIAARDDGGLQVGPQSAGSSPGPACFGLGGTQLTPTDVWLLLGYLEPGEFLGGRRTLDTSRASAVAAGLAETLGVGVEKAVLQAQSAVRRALADQMREWAERQRGLLESAPEDRWLFSYGGGGGLLAADAADALDIPRVVVFPHSSVFSAFGGGLLPIAHAYEAVVPVGSPPGAVGEAVGRLADNARRDLRSEGITDLERVEATVTSGGAAEPVTTLRELVDRAQAPAGGAALAAAIRVRLGVSVPRDARIDMLAGEDAGDERTREIVTEGGRQSVPVIGGLGTAGAAPAEGPAFLEAPDTTIFVPAGWSVTFTEQGYGVLTNLEAQAR
jgi:N-methylhydantoinase A/acetophenone carboxylase